MQAVAKMAGVSHSTVSLILNGRGKELRIADETCQRVMKVAKELNYEANYFARSLKGKSTHTIAILWFFSGPHSEDNVIRLITKQAWENGYIAHFFDSLSDTEIILQLLKELSRRSVDGIILRITARRFLESPELKKALSMFRASVIVAQDIESNHIDTVHHYCRQAMDDVVAALIKDGRRRLAMIGGAYTKFDFAREAWIRLKRKEKDAKLLYVDWYRVPDRRKAVTDALASVAWGKRGFDSLLCSADEMAFIACDYFRSHGLAIPQDVSIAGFNNSLSASFFNPPVASVARNDEAVASKALEFLLTRLEQRDHEPQQAHVEMDFIPRASFLPGTSEG